MPGETLIGRSPECHITIEDPLISRQHGRILVSGSVATFEDLGSRNGSRVNGKPAFEPVNLVDGDRLRLGAQELVFLKVGVDQRLTRSTGAMRLCSRCKTPFPEGPTHCPHCGQAVTVVAEEDTVAGISVPVQRGWILQMLGEVLDRAIAQQRAEESHRLLRKVAEETEARISRGVVDIEMLSRVAEYAFAVSRLQGEPNWILWLIEVHQRAGRVPHSTVLQRLQAAAATMPGVGAALGEYVRAWQGRRAEMAEDDLAAFSVLSRFVEGGGFPVEA